MPTRKHPPDVCEPIPEAVAILVGEFFVPTCDRLFVLLNHPQFGVRVYSTIVLTNLVVGNLPAFTARPLADVAFRLKTLADHDAEERVRACARKHLHDLMEAAAAYGAVCREAAKQAASAKGGAAPRPRS